MSSGNKGLCQNSSGGDFCVNFTLLEKNNKSTTGFKSNARYLEGVISGVDGRRNTIVR